MALNAIYGSKSKSTGPPQGKRMKFIPYTADINYPSSAKLLHLAQIALNKQALYLQTIDRAVAFNITDLDYLIASHGIGCTLRQAIMSMKCEDGLTQLFTGVDQSASKVTFTFPKDHAIKATTAVNFLPSYLEQKFGPGMWS